MSIMQQRKAIFIVLFTLGSFIALQIPFTKLAGSNVSFTLFDFFGPIAGAFLGPVFSILSILTVEIANIAIHQVPVTTGSIIRLFPVVFAAVYFALMTKKNNNAKWILIVSLLAMVAFIAHPIGRDIWYYSLFWLIPVIAYFKKDWLLARSLGATFTAHAVGGAAWIWAFNLSATVWQGLIPVVIQERLVMALGISAAYLLMRKAVQYLVTKQILPPQALYLAI